MRIAKTIIPIFTVVPAILLAGGCASLSYSGPGTVQPGAVVQVKKPIEIPDREHRVYIQHGEFVAYGQLAGIISYRKVDEAKLYCSFLMQSQNSRGEPPVTVTPENFEVVKEVFDLL